MDKQHLLLGGQNRELASDLAIELASRLAERFRVIDVLDDIPKELRGVHKDNPVNSPRQQGVQLELPPGVRWNRSARSWADAEGLEPTAEVEQVIAALAATAKRWMTTRPGANDS